MLLGATVGNTVGGKFGSDEGVLLGVLLNATVGDTVGGELGSEEGVLLGANVG